MRIWQHIYTALWFAVIYLMVGAAVWSYGDETLTSWFIGVSAFVGVRWFVEHTTPKVAKP